MRSGRLLGILVVCACLMLFTGCGSGLRDLRIQNETQRKHIEQLESKLKAAELELDRLRRQLDAAGQKEGIEVEALQQKIAALEEDLAKKKELIASMQERLLYGGAPLPVELTTKLEDFAKANEMVEYDSSRGIVKFKSDLLFEKGSDTVAPTAIEAVKALCGILNSEEAQGFDAIIAGHTDDIPILRPATREKHPTNWHLSAHRAISVLNLMESSGVAPKRMSIRGFSEYRPVADNQPGRRGNPKNRRVEIYIVPQGV